MLPTVAVRMAGGETQPENGNVADPVQGDKTDDAGRWWRAYQLAENDQVDEFQRLAAAGDDHARRQLASWLADCDRLDELRERAGTGGYHASRELAGYWPTMTGSTSCETVFLPAAATTPCVSWPGG
jgi:hypothetical protein